MVLLKQHAKNREEGGNGVTNVKLLEEWIQKSGLKKGYLAKQIGVSRGTFLALTTNKKEFKTSHLGALCKLLGIKDDETVRAIFFDPRGA